jgi:hypothetical protein
VTSRDFCFWLQGFLELRGEQGALLPKQVACVQAHLALVFKHEIDPSMGDKPHQVALDHIHDVLVQSGHAGDDFGPPKYRC